MIPIIAVVIINIIAGAANTLVASGMNKVMAEPSSGASAKQFSHPFVQTLIMMIGEGFCLLVFALIYWRTRNHDPSVASPWHWGQLLFFIPSCIDWCTTSMLYASMLDLPGSQVQMLRGSLVIFVFLISIFVLRNRVYKHHYLGVLIVVLGITCVGLSAVSAEKPPPTCRGDGTIRSNCGKDFHCVAEATHLQCTKNADCICMPAGATHIQNPTRGVIVCIIAQILAAILMTSEEKIFKTLHTPAIFAVGIEGCSGVLIGVVVLAITGMAGIETPGEAAHQIFHSRTLFLTCLMLCISIASFNCTGVQITKSISSTARASVDGLRTLLVWFGDLSFGWTSTDVASLAFWLQPLGFSITMLGTLIYFNTIAIPSLMGEEELVEYHARTQQAREMQESGQAFLSGELREDELTVPYEPYEGQTFLPDDAEVALPPTDDLPSP